MNNKPKLVINKETVKNLKIKTDIKTGPSGGFACTGGDTSNCTVSCPPSIRVSVC